MTRLVYTLLLIDDNASDRAFYRQCLLTDETCTYQFLEASCAADGLALCQTQTIDAVLLALADGDGIAFLETLRDTEKIPPVIMINEQTDERVIVRAIKLGAADYLNKQYLDSERLQTSIQNSIDNSQSKAVGQGAVGKNNELELKSVFDQLTTARQDISDRQRSQEILSQSEERYRYLSSLIPQLVWIADPNGIMLDVNERWTEFTGLTLEQAQTDGWQQIVYPGDVTVLGEAWRQAQQDGGQYQAEGRIRRADGVYRWHLHQALPLRGELGQIVKWFGTATDIHDLKQSEADRAQLLAEAQAARQEAEAANRSKDQFVAMVAHELRSPLNSIQGWARLLQTRKFNEATLTKAVDTIVRNTESQVQLIEDLLDISRLIRGNLHLNRVPLNWVMVIHTAVDMVRPQAQAKQISIETNLGISPQIAGDFNRLQQVVINLLTNAIKFTPDRGRIEVQLKQQDAQVQLCISDTGKGITPEFLPHIFEQFQQGQDNSGTKDGLGLGLAIAKNLVELHGGTIWAESAGINQGSIFTVQLPILSASAIVPPPALAEDAMTLAGIRILLVDDEPDQIELMTFVLEDCGAVIQSALNATLALECLNEFQPDLLISDLAMPGNDGYELLRQVRLHPAGNIPAIVLTAYASTTIAERSRQAGFQCHLTKPVEPEILIAEILRLMKAGKRNDISDRS
jgi:PAS domain S-box-containing protein